MREIPSPRAVGHSCPTHMVAVGKWRIVAAAERPILTQELRAQLQAGQKLVARFHAELEHDAAEAASMKRVFAELQHDRGPKEEAQHEDTVRIRSQFIELALKA